MALRPLCALLAFAAAAACSSTDSGMYARDPYAVSSSRNPMSFSEAFGRIAKNMIVWTVQVY